MSDKKRAVFLDRDGVLNEAPVRGGRPYSPRLAAEFRILPEAPEALAKLKKAGFLLVVATNQPDVGRGDMAAGELEAMHSAMKAALPLDLIKVCTHDDKDGCHCRKPKPGMLTDAARELGIDLSQSYMIGDRWRDIECADSAGVKGIFIDRGYTEPQPSTQAHTATDVDDAVRWILSQ